MVHCHSVSLDGGLHNSEVRETIATTVTDSKRIFNQRGAQVTAKRRQTLMVGVDREVYICA